MKKHGVRKLQLNRETLQGLRQPDQPGALADVHLEVVPGGRPAVTALAMSCEGVC